MRRFKKSFIRWTVVAMICLLLGFLLGKFKQGMLSDALTTANSNLQTVKNAQSDLSKEFARLQVKSMIDDQTINGLSQENKTLNEKLNTVSNKLYFYERVVAPETQSSGVKIYSFTVVKNLDARQWDYELVLMQAQKGRRFLNGSFNLDFSVFAGETLKTISLNSVSSEVESKFKFKYFQTIKGSFNLAPETTVDEVIINLKVKGNRWYKAQQLQQRYDWRILIEKDAENLSEFDSAIIAQ